MLKVFFILLITITTTFANVTATADPITKDLNFILHHHVEKQVTTDMDTSFLANRVSELKIFSIALVKLYQVTISSQDISACNFTPSCSGFTMEAICKEGILKGSLMGADRLLRCHWFTYKCYHKKYGIVHDTGKLYDPVERYLHIDKNE